MGVHSIQKLSQEDHELKVLIGSLKNVLTDVPYDFMYEDENDNEESNNELTEE